MLRRSLSLLAVVFSTSPAFAQTAETPPVAPAAEPAPPTEPMPPPAAPAPAPAPAAEAPLTESAAAAPAGEAPAVKPAVSFNLFADGYYSFNTNQRNNMGDQPAHRAFARNNGFSLSFMGIDANWDNGKVGATASLRFGPSVPIFYAADLGPLGIDNILQAFATWHAAEGLDLDFGQFGTIYGAEVAESWLNLNYTRGALYYAMQPFWHTGLRATYAASDSLTLKGMVVNGVNNIIDSGASRPSIGVQAAYAGGPLSLIVGYLGSTDPEEDAYFDHFVDVVANLSLGELTLLFNGDFAMDTEVEGGDNTKFFGLSLAAGYRLSDQFRLAVRGEYLADLDNSIYGVTDASDLNLTTGTLTFDYRPAPNIILRWDNRIEVGSSDIFFKRNGDATGTWFQSVLGVVVTSSI